MVRKSLLGLTYDQFILWMAEHGQSKYWASKIWNWVYRKRQTNFSNMTDVKAECSKLLEENFIVESLSYGLRQESVDGTVKFLFKLTDGHFIETVMMRHKYGISVCVTTQVGCNMGCDFCASGLLAKIRNLDASEIVEQIIKVQQYLDDLGKGDIVNHVVVMGIGEPFDNYHNVLSLLKIVMDHKGLAIAGRCITLSTCGLAHKIYEFADEKLPVNLAISLHAPNDKLRSQIMNINKAIPLDELMKSLIYYIKKSKRRLTIEYILLKGINDSRDMAIELANLLQDIKQKIYVNLIPYNPVDEHSRYQRSNKEIVLAFYDALKREGINCVIRQEHGIDIDAACGQLRSRQMVK